MTAQDTAQAILKMMEEAFTDVAGTENKSLMQNAIQYWIWRSHA